MLKDGGAIDPDFVLKVKTFDPTMSFPIPVCVRGINEERRKSSLAEDPKPSAEGQSSFLIWRSFSAHKTFSVRT